ncbi:cobalt-precorrin-8 methylmutase [Vibrio gazogenes]|uniref:Precorrin-8X methylmutase n=1 Tax=Vibrio gazogenes DSM 21264 = NBRC 103151 TaxID=1123492 RepID=A0A1M4URY1_VIBGA|nr:cobalt-precorrin-8 methylmutase [Vibrio gazogenes]USP15693.1 cobalt-precorrin-8 methylmutase [Vibrio gazogenes]SHE59454.1 precorrin-8X methylmutase [Vibrio gazogenes DSM 21264] [Vibrio gazogenes DSM 21264 = NBRC 103151]SJN56177.1 Cobalt-precorrin-8X methylmutase [Vibrio gazogenes]
MKAKQNQNMTTGPQAPSFIQQPQQIESTSFEIIDQIIQTDFPTYRFRHPLEQKIITRAIHTTADFDWLEILKFSPTVLTGLQAQIAAGCVFYTDTTMVLAGMNKSLLRQFGCEVRCYIADPDVAAIAKAQGKTRSMVAVEKALAESDDAVFVFGNAPTALFQLLQSAGAKRPVTIGVPVGFVGAAESKQALYDSDFPFITALGRKGGSNVAAAIVNAVLYDMQEGR